MLAFELSLLDWIAAHLRADWLDPVMVLVSRLVDYGLIWIVLALVLLARRSTRVTGLALALALIAEVLLCSAVLKPLFARVRPFEYRDLTLLLPPPTDGSFPSGHTAASAAVAAALLRRRSRLGPPVLAAALLVAFSRLYLYLHFPSDVLGGALLGAILGILASGAAERLAPRLERS